MIRAFDSRGREVFLRPGRILPEGTITQRGNDFQTLETPVVYRKSRVWNTLTQSWDESEDLIPIEK
jgi:hypothetical protein